VLSKYSKPESTTSIDSPNNKTIKEEEISFSNDPFEALEFVTSSVNQSRSSAGVIATTVNEL